MGMSSRSRHTASVPAEGVVPPSTRLAHSSIPCAPPRTAASADSMESTQASTRTPSLIRTSAPYHGALRADGEIDTDRTRELIGAARPLRVTFHRAFDVCRDPAAALEALIVL